MNEKGTFIEVKVFRFDPPTDKEPRYEVYQVPSEGYSVLNVLQYIYDNYDKSLAYRSGCLGKGGSRCGACPILVNGIPALSCQRMAEAGMVIEPHPKFEQIKDLVVNFSQVQEHSYGGQQIVEVIVDKDRCVGCNDCVIICPVGVYKLGKIDGKNKAVPVDVGSCCGLTCQMCVNCCWREAITIKPDLHQ